APVDLDLIVAAPTGATAPAEVLWPQRQKLPFLMLDQPALTSPELTALVDLPDGQTLYRIHWRVWSGWHLFWTSTPAQLDRAGGPSHARRAAAPDPAGRRGVADPPIQRLAARSKGLFVFVLDTDADAGEFHDRPARTPYARRRLPADDKGDDGQIAGWTWWYD